MAIYWNICGVSLPFNAKNIVIGLTDHISVQATINIVLIILKYYIYVCRCKCRAVNLEGGPEFLKYAITIEKASKINVSAVSKEHVQGEEAVLQCGFESSKLI